MSEKCIKKIIDASNNRLTRDEAVNIMKEIELNRQAWADKNPGYSNKDLMDIEKRNLAEKQKASMLERYNRLKNFAIKEGLMEHLKLNKADPVNAMTDVFINIERDQLGIRSLMHNEYITRLKKEGVYDAYRTKEYANEVATELAHIQNQDFPDPNLQSRTGVEDAFKIAKVMNSIREDIIRGYNDEGADVRAVKQHIGEQNYNSQKVSDVGREEFIRDWLNTIDRDRTFRELFDGKAPTDDQLNNIYDAFASGEHAVDAGIRNLTIDEKTGKMVNVNDLIDPMSKFKGPANLSKQLSRHRKYFYNPEKWNEFFTKYGHGDVYDNLDMAMTKYGNNKALMKTLGSNPEAMIDTVVKDFAFDTRKEIGSKGDGNPIYSEVIKKKLDQLIGRGNAVENTPKAKTIIQVSDTMKAWNVVTMLQNVVMSSVGDLSLMHKEYAKMNGNFFSGFGKVVNDFQKAVLDNQTKDDRALIDFYLDYQEDFTRRFQDIYRFSNPNDSVADTVSIKPSDFKGIGHRGLRQVAESIVDAGKRLGLGTKESFNQHGIGRAIASGIKGTADLTMEMSLLPHWDRNKRTSFSAAFSKFLGDMSDRSWDQLPEKARTYLDFYDLKDHWDEIRQFTDVLPSGRKAITPGTLQSKLSDSYFLDKEPGLSQVELRRRKLDLQLTLDRALRNAKDRAIPTTSKLDRTIFQLGLKRGEVANELISHMFQFLNYPVALVKRQFGQDIKKGRGLGSIAETSAYLFMWGLITIALKDVQEGKLTDYTKPVTYGRAFVQGAGVPYMGTFVKADPKTGLALDFSDMAGLLGPTVGNASQALQAGSDLLVGTVTGDKKKALTKSSRYIRNSIPFSKLPYTKMAFDFVVFDTAMNAMNPDYHRAQDKLDKDKGRTPLSEIIEGPRNIGEFVSGDY